MQAVFCVTVFPTSGGEGDGEVPDAGVGEVLAAAEVADVPV